MQNKFIIGAPSKNPDKDFLNFIKEYRVKGVILFSKNYENKIQLTNLIDNIKKIDNNILICVDHEGGRVQRFINEFTKVPSFREVCKNKTYIEIYNYYSQIAVELKKIKIDLNFTPVADMVDLSNGVIGDRSIGTDLNEVIKGVTACIKAYEDNGLLTSVKHFPGHGAVVEDTHFDLAVSYKTFDELLTYELLPFIEAVKFKVSSIMLSHIVFANIDKVPVSVSKVFNKFIREELKYQGLLITDDMSMGAILKYNDLKISCKEALSAGANLLIVSMYNKYDLNYLANIIDYCS